MLRIVTDGATDMPAGWQEEFQIHVLPLNVVFGDETYTQGIDINSATFYEMVNTKRKIPTTSLPSPRQVVDFYRRIAQRGDEVLSIHLASKLSGTFTTIQMAAQEIASEFKIYTFDSGAGSAAVGFMCREARLMERAGTAVHDIVVRLENIRKQLTLIFTVDNLEFARLSGRVNALQSTISSLLKIKPIIVLKDGLLIAADKVRTRQRALDTILDMVRQQVGNHPVMLAVVHAADPETARGLMDRARSLFNVKEIIVADLSIPVAAHLGPGTVGLVAYPAEEY